jgi:hypothetical protein
MVCGVRGYLLCSILVLSSLAVLAGCSGRFFAEREPWRREAEIDCLTSGAVSEGAGKVRIEPISGPGACGADFPLKVSSLGVDAPLAFGDDVRPPSTIPNAAAAPRSPVPGTGPRPPDRSFDPYYAPRPRYDQPLSLEPRAVPEEPTRQPPAPYYPPARERAPVLRPARARPAPPAPPVSVTPPATLACPLVSVLDQWIDTAVQPSALRWFGQPVVEIRQLSSYSCRGMNGNPNAHISEHAFGNALDVASFTLANGRTIAVKSGWYGAPEEQGFLHDVQGAACDRFTTVLAPGSDSYHFDHIHVDLMRRASGHRACNPHAVSGEEVAARVRGRSIGRRYDPAVTGALAPRRASGSPITPSARDGVHLPAAVPGADGQD